MKENAPFTHSLTSLSHSLTINILVPHQLMISSPSYTTCIGIKMKSTAQCKSLMQSILLTHIARISHSVSDTTSVFIIIVVVVSGVTLWMSTIIHFRASLLSQLFLSCRLVLPLSPVSWRKKHHLLNVSGLALVVNGENRSGHPGNGDDNADLRFL